ncbi:MULTISPECIES: hypothetical protein [unclassified Pseudomonas]|uniref:hypothetical protein n=1 Tax=unclassified Pseudomonas TaxID=196821 RepID=UPI002E8227BF|nr:MULTISPECIES: hypothetical protein [unclassified Pseudomonas]
MSNLCDHWLISLEEKNRVGKELINQIRALHFSIQMITKLVSVRDDSLSFERAASDSGLVIYQNSAQDADFLSSDLQKSLDKARFLIKDFIADASTLVRYVESYVLTAPPQKNLKPLVDMCFAVNDLVCALEGWQNNCLEQTMIGHAGDR